MRSSIEVFGFHISVKIGRKKAIKQYIDLSGQGYSLDDAKKICQKSQGELEAQYPEWTSTDSGVHYTMHFMRIPASKEK